MNLLSARVPNQLVQNGNFESTEGWIPVLSTISVANNVLTGIITSAEAWSPRIETRIESIPQIGHKYYIEYYHKYSESYSGITNIYWGGIQTISNDTMNANTWYKRQMIISNITSSMLAFYLYVPIITVGATYSFKNVNLIDLTELYGAGLEPATPEAFRADYPLDYYPYSATSYTGLLQQNGKAVTADIASLLPSGIGVVDLGSLNYIKGARNNADTGYIFYLTISNIFKPYSAIISNRFRFKQNIASWENLAKDEFAIAGVYLVLCADYNDVSSLKLALSGVLAFSNTV